MVDILTKITDLRREDLVDAKEKCPIEMLYRKVEEMGDALKPKNLWERLYQHNIRSQKDKAGLAIAAEFKRASPSKGEIAMDANVKEQVLQYAQASASIVSVLTETRHFRGCLKDMLDARHAVDHLLDRPVILRKDFIVDEYQLVESRAYGADTVLLIVAILTQKELTILIQKARDLGMEPLVEVNNTEELDIALKASAKVIGVNNRNLRTFEMDLKTTIRVADAIRQRGLTVGKEGISLLALSGISTRKDVEMFEACGCSGILVGESLMRSLDPSAKIQELLGVSIVTHKVPLTKVCGISTVEAALTAVRAGANMIGMIFVPNTPRYVDVGTASKIVQAVRQFGERDGLACSELLGGRDLIKPDDWFEVCAKRLDSIVRKTPVVVGVFMNQSVDDINNMAIKVGLDMIQLHGDEGFDICREIHRPVLRVVHLPDEASHESVNFDAILEHIQPGLAVGILLDSTLHGQKGGTGVSFDWTLATRFKKCHIPTILAGGINASNVRECMDVAHPFGLDISSGVEVSKGVKDPVKIKEFLQAVNHPLV